MTSAYKLVCCVLSLLLIGALGSPPISCSNPDNANTVVPLRRVTSTGETVNLGTSQIAAVDGCWLLSISPYNFYVSHSSDNSGNSAPYSNVGFSAQLFYTCGTPATWYLGAYQTFYYQTLVNVANNFNQASISGLYVYDGTAYGPDGPVGFSFTTTPVSLTSRSSPTSKSTYRSVNSNTGSPCRIDLENIYSYNGNMLTSSGFTLTMRLGDGGPLNFVFPANLQSSASISTTTNTYHQCTCSGL